MCHEGSPHCSQQPVISLYPDRDDASPYSPKLLPEDTSYFTLSIYSATRLDLISIDIGVSFPESKAVGAWVLPITSIPYPD
jgi:hypothetical protein